MQHTKARLYTIHNIRFPFHHKVPITAGWAEAMWGEKFAQNFYARRRSRTHDPWLHKVQESKALTIVLCVPTLQVITSDINTDYDD